MASHRWFSCVLPLGFCLLFRYSWIVVHQRVERSVRSDQSSVGHDPARVFDQPLLLALRHDAAEHRLENLFAEAVADSRERRVVRHVIGE